MSTQLRLDTVAVDLTEAELLLKARELADVWRQLRQLKADHAEQRAEMKHEVVDGRAAYLADVIRTGREERPVAR